MSQKVKQPGTADAPMPKVLGRGLVIVAEDEASWADDIVGALGKAFGDTVDYEVRDNYREAIGLMKANAHRVIGVVSDVSYYRAPYESTVADDTDRCGLEMVGEAKRIVKNVPVVLESDVDYSNNARLLKADAFLPKKDIETLGPELFKRLFKVKEAYGLR